MSYSKFQNEAGILNRSRTKQNLPYLPSETTDAIIRDQWITEKRYKELIAFILENWESGNCESFKDPLVEHLIINKENQLYKQLWKGIIRHRTDLLWDDHKYLMANYPDCTLSELLKINLKGYNQFRVQPIDKAVAWRRQYCLSAIDSFINGLETLQEKEEIQMLLNLKNQVATLEKQKPKPSSDKRKIDESVFWELIDTNRTKSANKFEFLDNLKLQLEQFKPNEIRRFDKFVHLKMNELESWDIWALAFIVKSGCGDDGFEDFKAWVVSKGETTFNSIKNLDHNKLKDCFDEDPGLEEFMYLVDSVYESKTGESMKPNKVKRQSLQGNQWDENNLKMNYPILCQIFDYPGD